MYQFGHFSDDDQTIAVDKKDHFDMKKARNMKYAKSARLDTPLQYATPTKVIPNQLTKQNWPALNVILLKMSGMALLKIT